MNKLLLNVALLIVLPPVGLFLTITDRSLSVETKTITLSIGLTIGTVLYALLYLFIRQLFAPVA
ncbi:MAG: hypothetical protein WCA07_01565 [Gloeobacterales cyanobacterium]